jgi:hypothetical protein
MPYENSFSLRSIFVLLIAALLGFFAGWIAGARMNGLGMAGHRPTAPMRPQCTDLNLERRTDVSVQLRSRADCDLWLSKSVELASNKRVTVEIRMADENFSDRLVKVLSHPTVSNVILDAIDLTAADIQSESGFGAISSISFFGCEIDSDSISRLLSQCPNVHELFISQFDRLQSRRSSYVPGTFRSAIESCGVRLRQLDLYVTVPTEEFCSIKNCVELCSLTLIFKDLDESHFIEAAKLPKLGTLYTGAGNGVSQWYFEEYQRRTGIKVIYDFYETLP